MKIKSKLKQTKRAGWKHCENRSEIQAHQLQDFDLDSMWWWLLVIVPQMCGDSDRKCLHFRLRMSHLRFEFRAMKFPLSFRSNCTCNVQREAEETDSKCTRSSVQPCVWRSCCRLRATCFLSSFWRNSIRRWSVHLIDSSRALESSKLCWIVCRFRVLSFHWLLCFHWDF